MSTILNSENVKGFAQRAQERKKQKCKDDADMDDLAAAFDPAVTSKGPGSSITMADDAMDVNKEKDDTTKKGGNGGTGGSMGSTAARAHTST